MLPAVLLALSLVPFQASSSSDRRVVSGQAQPAPVLTILFFTASWCEPCRAVSPILARFTRKNEKSVKLAVIDFDRARKEVARWGVQEIPVVIVLSPQGKILLRCDGAEPQALSVLESGLQNLFKNSKERK